MQDYDKGWLKMIHLKHYIDALKSTWVRRVITNDFKYKTLFETKYVNVKDLIKRGTEFLQELKTNQNNKFWNDVLESWIRISDSLTPTKFEDIMLTNLWNNKELKINNRTIYYQRWFDKHIYFIKDLLDENGPLMDYNQFIQKYSLTINIMEYYGVRSVVEAYIRIKGIQVEITPLTNCSLPLNVKEILKSKQGCRDMYQILNNKDHSPKSQVKWNEIFETVELNWNQIHNIPAKCCNNTKLHWFQYRIFHRIIATNGLLFKCNIKQDNLCTFCKNVPEKNRTSVLALFYCNGVLGRY